MNYSILKFENKESFPIYFKTNFETTFSKEENFCCFFQFIKNNCSRVFESRFKTDKHVDHEVRILLIFPLEMSMFQIRKLIFNFEEFIENMQIIDTQELSVNFLLD